MADAVQAWCGRCFRHDRRDTLLILAGTYGTGKTHCLSAAHEWMRLAAFSAFESKAWMDMFPTVAFKRWPVIADAIRAKEMGSIEDCISSGILFLDDVGADDDPFHQATDKLCQILSRREMMHTMITTNVGQSDWQAKFDGRIHDRFFRNSVVVDLDGVESYSI